MNAERSVGLAGGMIKPRREGLPGYTCSYWLQLLRLEVLVSDMLADDVRLLRAALEGTRDQVSVTLELSRSSAEKVLALLDAERSTGAIVVPVKELFSTTEAATMLGVSRPSLMKMIESGQLEHIKVGSHHRIPVESLVNFQRTRRAGRQRAAEALADFANEIGFVD